MQIIILQIKNIYLCIYFMSHFQYLNYFISTTLSAKDALNKVYCCKMSKVLASRTFYDFKLCLYRPSARLDMSAAKCVFFL